MRSTGLKSRPVGPISATGPVFPISRYGIICVNDFPENKTMSATTTRETLGFQAEVKQLLQLMIHSLYSNK